MNRKERPSLQAMGLFADSAEYHEAIADLADRSHPSYQKFEHARDASYNAVVLRVATGDTDRAVQNGNKYLKEYGEHLNRSLLNVLPADQQSQQAMQWVANGHLDVEVAGVWLVAELELVVRAAEISAAAGDVPAVATGRLATRGDGIADGKLGVETRVE